ncbi:MAG: metallophosphoesterase family protein [Gammaproteobacteria bacterium]|nr:metallophosphoesterase family protein [Gammaproteobacteria bacterium]MCY4228522.1 metallophosphoesterase family protein [Gammaproteobacteria bacterium]
MHYKTHSVPDDTHVYAIGDIHGRVDLLAKMLDMIRHDVAGETANRRVLVFLGDYVDRGLQSRQVIDLLLSGPMPGFEAVFLKGNHDELLLAYLEDESVGEYWFSVGGDATLLSYGIACRSGQVTNSWKQFQNVLPASHRSFLSGLSSMHVEGDYAFTHAGIRPGKALAVQRDEDLMWGCEKFADDERDHGKMIVHGHFYAPEPEVRHNRIGIDTGACATGCLTCLVLSGATQRFLYT